MSEGSPKRRVKSQEPGAKTEVKAVPIAIGRLKAKGDAKPDEENHSVINTTHSELNETLTTDNSPLTTKMEVHHHPDLHHKEKPWKEYLLEGFMIFVAVTMGFFAETIREDISDRSKGHEYIRSFVEDLQRDTTTLAVQIAYDKKKLAALNDLPACYDSVKRDNKTAGCLVPVIKNSMSNRNGSFSDGTMQQLKNAGFRLLNKSDKDSIVAYDHAVRTYLNFEFTLFQQRQDIVRDVYVKLIDFKAQPMLTPDSLATDVQLASPLLFSNDKALINEYFNDLWLYKRAIMRQASIFYNLKKKATGLIKYFDNKYDLE